MAQFQTCVVVLLHYLCMMSTTVRVNSSRGTIQFLKNINSNYSKEMQPYAGEKPIEVKCSVAVSAFSSVNEKDMDYSMTFNLRKKWHDPRLQFDSPDSVVFQSEAAEILWVPVTFFPDAKYGILHDLTDENQILEIWPDGTVVRTMRLTMTLICHMNAGSFPMDSQQCSLKLQSLAYHQTELVLVWDDNAVTLRDSLHVPTFHVSPPILQSCESSEFHKDEYSCLEVVFQLERSMVQTLLQIYLTSTLVVFLSWISFWINPRSEPARVTIGMTSILTLSTEITGVQNSIPGGSNASAIDVWLAICLVFVFAVLIEFAAVSYGHTKLSKRRMTRDSQHNTANSKVDDKKYGSDKSGQVIVEMEAVTSNPQDRPSTSDSYVHYRPGCCERFRNNFKVEEPADMDHCCRILFPLAFLIFNIAYWCSYLLL
ncbi:glycine receptor subunit alpha-2-like [Glandiceps talaboti]